MSQNLDTVQLRPGLEQFDRNLDPQRHTTNMFPLHAMHQPPLPPSYSGAFPTNDRANSIINRVPPFGEPRAPQQQHGLKSRDAGAPSLDTTVHATYSNMPDAKSLRPLPPTMFTSLLPLPPNSDLNSGYRYMPPQLPLSLRVSTQENSTAVLSPATATTSISTTAVTSTTSSQSASQADLFDDSASVVTTATGTGSLASTTVASTVVSTATSAVDSVRSPDNVSRGSGNSSLGTQPIFDHPSPHNYYAAVEFDVGSMGGSPKPLPSGAYNSLHPSVPSAYMQWPGPFGASGTHLAHPIPSQVSASQPSFSLNLANHFDSHMPEDLGTLHVLHNSAVGESHTERDEDDENDATQEEDSSTLQDTHMSGILGSDSIATSSGNNSTGGRNSSSTIIVVPIKRGRGRPKRAAPTDNQPAVSVKPGAGDSDTEDVLLDESILNGTSLALALPDTAADAKVLPLLDILSNDLPWDDEDRLMQLIKPSMLPQVPTGVSLMIDSSTQTIVAASRRRGRPSRAMIEEQQVLLQKLIVDHFRTQRKRYLNGSKTSSANGSSTTSDESAVGTEAATPTHPFSLSTRTGGYMASECSATGVDIAATGATAASLSSSTMGAHSELNAMQHYYTRPGQSVGYQSYPYTGRILEDEGSPSEVEEESGSRTTLDAEGDVSESELDTNFNLGLSHHLSTLHGFPAPSLNQSKMHMSSGAPAAVLGIGQQPPQLDRYNSSSAGISLASNTSRSSSRPDSSNEDDVCFFDESSDSLSGSGTSHSSSPMVASRNSAPRKSESALSGVQNPTALHERKPLRTSSQRVASVSRQQTEMKHTGAVYMSGGTGGYKPQYALPSIVSEGNTSDEEEDDEASTHSGSQAHSEDKRLRKSGSNSKFNVRMSKKDRNKLSAMKYRQKRKLFMEQLEMKAGMMEHVLLCLLEENDALTQQLEQVGVTPLTSSLGSLSSRILRIARENEVDLLQQLHSVDENGNSLVSPPPQLFVADVSCQALQEAEKQFMANQAKLQSQGMHTPTGPMSVLAAHTLSRTSSPKSNVSSRNANFNTSQDRIATLGYALPGTEGGLNLHPNGLGNLSHIAELEPDLSDPIDQSGLGLGVKRARMSFASQGMLMFALFSFFFMISPFAHTSNGMAINTGSGLGLFLPSDVNSVFADSSAVFQSSTSHVSSVWSSIVSVAESLNPYPTLPSGNSSPDIGIASYLESFENQTTQGATSTNAKPASGVNQPAVPLPRSRVLLAHENGNTNQGTIPQGSEEGALKDLQQQSSQAQPPQAQQQHLVSPQALFSILLKSAQYGGGSVPLPHLPDNAGVNGPATGASASQPVAMGTVPTMSVLDIMSLLWHVLMPILFYFMLTRCGILETINISLYGQRPKQKDGAVGVAPTASGPSAATVTPPMSAGSLVRSNGMTSNPTGTATTLLTEDNVVAALATNEVLATHSKANAVAAVADAAAHAMLLRHQQEQQQRKQALAEQMMALQRDERLLQQQAQYLYQRQQHLHQYKIYQQQLQQQQLQEQEQLRRLEQEQLALSGTTK